MQNLILTANYLAKKLEDTGRFKILSDRTGKGVPLVAFCLKERKEFYDEVSNDLSSSRILNINALLSLIFLLNCVSVVG